MSARPLRAAIFASGSGSNLEVLVRHAMHADPQTPSNWAPVLTVTDRAGCGAVQRSEALGVPVAVVVPGETPSLLEVLTAHEIDIVILAGYLRLIPAEVVRHFEGRMLNLHPSLLPAFGGKGMYGRRVHEAVLASSARVTGVTVHLVNEHFDEGVILAQWPVAVETQDTPDHIASRIQRVEHALYPLVVDHVARALISGESPAPLAMSSLLRSNSGLVFP